eukprot:PhM_4_TR1106/c0_g1_i1/m.55003/K14079/PAPD4, GLD2; poly(A) RNA polymerase GLD2
MASLSLRPSVTAFVRNHLMTPSQYHVMSARRDAFRKAFLTAWPHPRADCPELYLYGSTLSCTALHDGDVDFALALDKSLPQVPRSEQADLLTHLYLHMSAMPEATERGFIPEGFHRIFRARVPVLQYIPPKTKKESTTSATSSSSSSTVPASPENNSPNNDTNQQNNNINNSPKNSDVFKFDVTMSLHGVRNSLLLREYVRRHPLVRPLVLLLKLWGHKQCIIDSRNGWLSSYAITLMLVEYLQAAKRVDVVAPADVKIQYPASAYDDFLEFNDTDVPEDVQQLLAGFFRYFTESFDFDEHIVDVSGGAFAHKPGVKEAFFTSEEDAALSAEDKWHRIGHGVIVIRDPYEDHSLGRSVEFFKGEALRSLLEWSARHVEALTPDTFESAFLGMRPYLPRTLLKSNSRNGIIC